MAMSALYRACRNGDFGTVQQLLPTLSLDQINQIESNGSTSLHAACQFNRPQIVRLLLDRGAVRTTLNNYGCTAFDEAATEQVKQLFPRSLTAARERFLTDAPIEEVIEWTSLEYGPYGWVNKRNMNNKDVIKAADSIIRDERLRDASSMHKIEYFLDKARRTEDPKWLAHAYSAEIGMCQSIKKALAQGSSHINGLHVEDFHSFAGVFFHHDALRKYRYTGRCYRGMKLSKKDFEETYKVGQVFLIKPFISTSKCRRIAEQFATAPSSGSRPLSILCIYTIPEHTLSYSDNVALDISSISEYPHEDEVLILPHTSLKIQNVSHLPSGLIEIEMGWYSFRRDPPSANNCFI
jgi:hypothetical protein